MGRVVSYNEDIPRCTFCGKTERQVRKLVAGPNASICDECIALCVDIISEERSKDAEVNSRDLCKPMSVLNQSPSVLLPEAVLRPAQEVLSSVPGTDHGIHPFRLPFLAESHRMPLCCCQVPVSRMLHGQMR